MTAVAALKGSTWRPKQNRARFVAGGYFKLNSNNASRKEAMMSAQLPLPLNPAQIKLMHSVLERIDQNQMIQALVQLYLSFIHSEKKEANTDENDYQPQNQ